MIIESKKAYAATNKMCQLYKEKSEMEELGQWFFLFVLKLNDEILIKMIK